MGKRVFNFNAGPAALPLPVLEEIQAEFLDYKGTGMSIVEISHRSKPFDAVINEAVARVDATAPESGGRRTRSCFIQGGASLRLLP